MNMYAILLAAGRSNRLRVAGITTPKQFLEYDGVPVFWHSAKTLAKLAEVKGIVFVFPYQASSIEPTLDEYKKIISSLEESSPLAIRWSVTYGGETRQESVAKGIETLPDSCEAVLIHDSARPFLSASLASKVAKSIISGNVAVIPGLQVSDTIKEVNEFGQVVNTPHRRLLRAVQTPQGFKLSTLRKAHDEARSQGYIGTDDAQLIEYLGETVTVVDGDQVNMKITTPADVYSLEKRDKTMRIPCTGFGYDVHKYGGIRPFILGGVPIKTDITISAHSDGDTLLHALMDAMLGLIGGGDIGTLFPDTDSTFDGISSGILLSEVYDKVQRAGVSICHVDITVIAQVPKISPHSKLIAKNVASLLQIPLHHVNVKATTEEHLGFTGEKKGIKVACVVTGLSSDQDL